MVSKFGSEEELFAEHLVVGLGWHDQGLSMQVVDTGHLGAAEGSSEGRVLAGLKLLPLRVAEGWGPNGSAVVYQGFADGLVGGQQDLLLHAPGAPC